MSHWPTCVCVCVSLSLFLPLESLRIEQALERQNGPGLLHTQWPVEKEGEREHGENTEREKQHTHKKEVAREEKRINRPVSQNRRESVSQSVGPTGN